MDAETEIIIHPRIVFYFYCEDNDEYHGHLLESYTLHYNPGNMQKHIKAARSLMRHFLRKYGKPITVEYFTETYEIEKRNDLPTSYAIKSKLFTEYLGQIACEEFMGKRLWYWSYWHDGNISLTHWRQEVNNT